MLYQENELVRQHVDDGHEALVIASTETHSPDGKIVYTNPGDYVGSEGARVIRLAYPGLFPAKLARKLRVHRGVMKALKDFQPDSILFHGLCGWELLTAANYVKDHPRTILYADSHEDWNNSARSFLSREVLHKIYYRAIIRRSLPAIRKVLCLSTEIMDFVSDVYGIKQGSLEFYPLGGQPVKAVAYEERRENCRKQYEIGKSQILFVQSGKQTKRKKLLETLKAFLETDDSDFRLFIIGSLFEEIKQEAERLISKDNRITHLGWKSPEELTDLLCAADIYLQPGTQSATMQHSLCCHCAIVLDDVPAHSIYHVNNGWLVNETNPLVTVFSEVSKCKGNLEAMGEKSYLLASEMLDYAVLANRVLS
jgi:glycosyltransferase involved in cell wall biosynthesis